MLCRVPIKQIYSLNKKICSTQIKKPTIGQYIIESLIDKNIKVAFGHKNTKQQPPILTIAKKYDNFNIVLDEYKQNSGYQALTYSKLNNNLGVIINNSSYGLNDIYKPITIAKSTMRPILIVSCFNTKSELSDSAFSEIMKSFIKRTITIETVNKNIVMDFESLLQYSYTDPPGPVHLNIANNILNKSMEFITNKEKDYDMLLEIEKYDKL